MNESQLQILLDQVASGATDAASARLQLLDALRARPFGDLGFARVDHHRAIRQGFPEVILGLGKTPAQVAAIAAEIVGKGSTLLVTRASGAAYEAVRGVVPDAAYYPDASIITFRQQDVAPGHGTILVVAAGTSDLPVVRECATTVEVYGAEADVVLDVGVAGLHRLLAERDRIDAADAVVAVAGMEAALPSVLAGLVGVPLIAVPTSVGYGWHMEGLTAWLAVLNSCAAGVVSVNVDNGFGAGVAAARIARRAAPSS